MRKVFLIAFLTLSVLMTVNAQNNDFVQFEGRVIDKNTMQPVPFANIGVVSTIYGTASDIDGNFKLRVPADKKTASVRFSAVGYSPLTKTINTLLAAKDSIFYLLPVSYKINEVEVSAESLVLQKIIRTASERINVNYINQPFEYQAYYTTQRYVEDSLFRKRESYMKLYDEVGYTRNSPDKVFKQLNYKFIETRKDFENHSLVDGLTMADNLLSFDIVRNSGNILDKYYLGQYDLNEEKRYVENGDTIVVIAYNNKIPTLSSTGDAYVQSYRGEIYINTSDYAVLKNELTIESSGYSYLGRSFYSRTAENTPVEYKVVTAYSKLNGYYYLSGTALTVLVKHSEAVEKIESQFVPVRINISDPERISKRDYYEDEAFRESFWNRFSIYFEGEI